MKIPNSSLKKKSAQEKEDVNPLKRASRLWVVTVYPMLGLVGSLIHAVLILIIWLIIYSVGVDLFQGQNLIVQRILLVVAILLPGQITIIFLNAQLHITFARSKGVYFGAFLLSLVYFIVFIGTSLRFEFDNLQYSNNSLWFGLTFACISPMFIGLMIGQFVGYNYRQINSKIPHAKISLSTEENVEEMDTELISQAFGFLLSIGKWAMLELSEIWKIKQQKKVRKTKKKKDVEDFDFEMDLSRQDQSDVSLFRKAIDISIKEIGASQVKHFLEDIQRKHEIIHLLRERRDLIDVAETLGRKPYESAKLDQKEIDKQIRSHLRAIEQEMEILGWKVEKATLDKD